jgi:flagellar L-ring protein FlgH
VVTIVINENSNAQFQANTAATKKDANSTNDSRIPLLDFLKVGLLDTVLKGNSTGVNSSVTGQGQTAQVGRFQTRMAAVVKQVLPNGTMLVEGTRTVKINRESQLFTLSGIIRQDDIRSDNTILSENLANAEIRSEGIGLIYDRQRRGILTRILDFLF